jgi:DNA-binding CsgD family transcriptional regulator
MLNDVTHERRLARDLEATAAEHARLLGELAEQRQRLATLRQHFSVPGAHPAPVLTAREREVLALLGQGLTNAEIASALDVTTGTARVYVKRIRAELVVSNRTQAAQRGRARPGCIVRPLRLRVLVRHLSDTCKGVSTCADQGSERIVYRQGGCGQHNAGAPGRATGSGPTGGGLHRKAMKRCLTSALSADGQCSARSGCSAMIAPESTRCARSAPVSLLVTWKASGWSPEPAANQWRHGQESVR